MNVRRALAALLLLSSLAPGVALADPSDADKATARTLTIEGVRALQKKDFAVAAERFTRADALYHAPTITLGLARAQVGLGKLVSAQELYSRTAHETVASDASAALKKAVLDAQKELDALAPRIPGVILQIKGTDKPVVTLDGASVPIAALGVKRSADPGEHVIHAGAEGFLDREVKVVLVEGKVATVEIQLERAPVVAPPPPVAQPAVKPSPPSPPAPVDVKTAVKGPAPPSAGKSVAAPGAPPAADQGAEKKKSLSHRWQPGVIARLDVDPLHPGARTAAGLTFGLFDNVEVGVSGLLGRDFGVEPQVTVFVLKGAWKPLVNVAAPLFFVDGVRAGVRGAAGLQWDPGRHFGVFAQVGGAYFPSVPEGYKSVTLLPSLGVQGRL